MLVVTVLCKIEASNMPEARQAVRRHQSLPTDNADRPETYLFLFSIGYREHRFGFGGIWADLNHSHSIINRSHNTLKLQN